MELPVAWLLDERMGWIKALAYLLITTDICFHRSDLKALRVFKMTVIKKSTCDSVCKMTVINKSTCNCCFFSRMDGTNDQIICIKGDETVRLIFELNTITSFDLFTLMERSYWYPKFDLFTLMERSYWYPKF